MTTPATAAALANALRRYADEIEQNGVPAPFALYINKNYEPHEEQREAVRAFLQSAGMDFEVKHTDLVGDQVIRSWGPLKVILSVKSGIVTKVVPAVREEVHVPSNAEILGSLYGAGR
jgi:hypothetical protein